jgi:enolase
LGIKASEVKKRTIDRIDRMNRMNKMWQIKAIAIRFVTVHPVNPV